MNKVLLFNAFLILFSNAISAQEFNHQYFDEGSKELHAIENDYHTSIKPVNFLENPYFNQITPFNLNMGLLDRFLNTDFFTVDQPDFKLAINPLFNLELGKEVTKNTYVNTRAIEAKGKIGDKISFYSSFYENQARFPQYLEDYIWNNELAVPGQGESKWYDRTAGGSFDFAMANGQVAYQASKHFDFQFGHGKNFFGDGYRSFFLSDNSFNYPYLKVTTSVWKVKYVNLFSSYQDLRDDFALDGVNRKKFSTMHYLSINLSKRLNMSLFEAIVWEQDTLGRGFDVNYFNPVIFYRPVEFSLGSRGGNALMGLGFKFKLTNQAHLYSQFIIDEFKLSEIKAATGWWANKYAGQIGGKYFDAFGLNGLFLQTELNFARPFMYSHGRPLQSYTHYNQPLAHPLGASFIEHIGIARYRYQRWYTEMKVLYALHGGQIPEDNINYGSDILGSYNAGDRMEQGNEIAQGNTTQLQIIDFKLGVLINPYTNMKLELGVMDRTKTPQFTSASHLRYWYVGFKTDLRNLYYDF